MSVILKRAAVLLSLAIVAACGGKAVIDGDPGSGGASTSSTGISVSSTGASMVTVTTGGPGSCASTAECSATDFCDFPGDTCGGVGTCRPRPGECTEECGEVCGCDGEVHCSLCQMQQKGIDGPGVCSSNAQEARAEYLPTGAIRLGVAVWDQQIDVCTWYVLEPGPPQPGQTITVSDPWNVAVSFADVSREACFAWLNDFQGNGGAVKAAGSIVVDESPQLGVCSLDLDTVVEFPQGGTSIQQFIDLPVGMGCN